MLALLWNTIDALLGILDFITSPDPTLIRSSSVGLRWLLSPSYREELRRNKNHQDLPRLDACAAMLAIAFVTLFSVGIFFTARHFVG